MDAQTMWKRFSEQNNCTEQEYEAWAFGGEPDKLANLVLSGERQRLLRRINYMNRKESLSRKQANTALF